MTIQQCKYVLKIAECGSFNEAAKHLFVAQSSLSVSVKQLEQELNIKIFERSGNGVYLTAVGSEFVKYAVSIVEQCEYVENRFLTGNLCNRLYIATQHYDFVAHVFGKLLNSMQRERYQFSLREMKTYDVISETERACCDIGIIAIKGSDSGSMERYLNQRGLVFRALYKTKPHVYLREGHPVANMPRLDPEHLQPYPYITYEQGSHRISFFEEEIATVNGERRVEISDRASLMNMLLVTDCYTLGTGIMPSPLNGGRIISVPFASDDDYTIGYILRDDRKRSQLVETFIKLLQETFLHLSEQ